VPVSDHAKNIVKIKLSDRIVTHVISAMSENNGKTITKWLKNMNSCYCRFAIQLNYSTYVGNIFSK